MKIKYLVLFFILLSQSLLAWGNTGHRIVGEIAETYLTKNAKMQIKKLIGHHDLSRISNWGDEIKADPEWDHAWDWHCLLYTSPSPRDLSTSRMPSSA